MSRRWLIGVGAAALGLALLAIGGVGGYVLAKRGESVDVAGSPTVEFVTTQAPAPKPPPLPGVAWPTWGFDNVRNRVSPYKHVPPFRIGWTFRARQLLEFPPAVGYGNLYVTNNRGTTFAIARKNGKIAWERDSGRCAAASPAIGAKVVYQAFLNQPPCNSTTSPSTLTGLVAAYDALTGKPLWRIVIGPTESSPLLHQGRVYVGDWRGNVYALDAKTGKIRWQAETGGRVKGAVSALGNRLFVGSYDGSVYAFDSRNGALQWRTSSQDRFGGRGRFYSTPSVAYGRVFIGSTDGKVYAFGATTGTLLWSTSTGGFVYSSPAVWNQTVYAGSYSGRLYAIDAATGATRWTFSANGPISGAPTVMAGRVYFATLRERTYGLDAKTGEQVWSYPDGKYTPLVADEERPYLIGHTRVYALETRR